MSKLQIPIRNTFMIPLTQGQVTAVDERDWYRLSKDRWCAQWDKYTQSFYAKRNIPHPRGGRRKDGARRDTQLSVHRAICGLVFGDKRQVDHINHDTLDNRRSNLRIVDNRGNAENRRKRSPHGPGIHFDSRCKFRPFHAHAWVDGKKHCIGFYATVEEASNARRVFLQKAALV